MSDTTQVQTLEQIRLALIRASDNRDLGEDTAAERLWCDFFNQYDRILRAFASKANCPRNSIDEVIRSVWLYVLKKLPEFEYDPQRGGFRRWLYKIVKNKAIDEVRLRGRLREVSLDEQSTNFWYQIIDPQSASQNDSLKNLYYQELVCTVMEQLKIEAPFNQWEVIQRFFLDLQSDETIAREMGIKSANVRKLRERGLARLKIIATEHFGADPLGFA